MKLTLYTRQGCHLCDVAKQFVQEARRRHKFEYEEFDIDAYPELCQRYNEEVPVIAIDGTDVLKGRVTVEELSKALAGRA